MHQILFLMLALSTSTLTACSTEQFYHMGQMWQKGECNKIGDASERNRCLANTNTPYEDYHRERESNHK